MKDAESAEEILAVEAELSMDRAWWLENVYDEEKRAMLTEFLQRFLSGIHEQEGRKKRLRWIAAPRQVWTLAEPGEYRGQEPIVSVQVHQVLTFFDGEAVREIRRRPVLRVEAP